MRLSLHHLTLTDATHAELVDIAAGLGCEHVCLFIKTPGEQTLPLPRVQSVQEARTLKQRLDGSGLSVWNVDTFMLKPGTDLAEYRETLDIAATLGARTLNTLNLDPDIEDAAGQLNTFAGLVEPFGLTLLVEWFRFSHTQTLVQAIDLVRLAKNSTVRLNVDILHLIRNGNRPEDLADVDPGLMQYAQICDGPMNLVEEKQAEEALSERNFPGEGEFPLASFIRHLPPDGVLSIEAPVNRLRPALSPADRASRAVAGTRRILTSAGR
jgi:sugar phosphate isomerase/epimerase